MTPAAHARIASLRVAEQRGHARAQFVSALYRLAPDCQYALRYLVADLLAGAQAADVLLNVADALREAAIELAFEGPLLAHQVRSLRKLGEVLAEDAARRGRVEV